LKRLAVINDLDKGPFPYDDCRKLVDGNPQYRELIPDLDVYFSEIAGYASAGQRLLRWSRERAEQVRCRLMASFFARFPRYESLKSRITMESTPGLFIALERSDDKRALLAELLDQIRGRT